VDPSSPATANQGDVDPQRKNMDKGKQTQGSPQGQEMTPEPMKTISPELRELLKREVARMDKKDVKKHGGGVGR
jgi:hypothetical protein